MSPSETNAVEAAKLMFAHMWEHGAYHLTTLMQDFTEKGVPAEIVAKMNLAQLKMEQKGVIRRIGPNIWEFAGRANATA